MEKINNEIKKINAFKNERSNIKVRNGSLIFLAFGTAIASMMIARTIASQLELSTLTSVFVQVFCIVFGYISIDAGVRNNLLASSDGNESKDFKDYFKRKSLFSIAFTVLFSLGASYFVGVFTKGESNYNSYNERVNVFSVRDSTNKALAAETLNRLSKDENKALYSAKNKAKQLVKIVVSRGSKSWQNDYKKAKNNPSHWLWTCTGKQSGCPKTYRQWRDDILNAKLEGEKLIADVTGTNNDLKKSLSNAFAYEMSKDSTLIGMKSNVDYMESERNSNSLLITLLLILITIAAAMSAYSANNSINKIRSIYGQQVEEGELVVFDVLEDFILQILAQFLSIIQGVLILIDKTLEKIGLDLYEIKKRSIANFVDILKGDPKDVAPSMQPVDSGISRTAQDVDAIAAMAVKREIEKREAPTLASQKDSTILIGSSLVDENSHSQIVNSQDSQNSTINNSHSPKAIVNNDVTIQNNEPTIKIVTIETGPNYAIWNNKKRYKQWFTKQIASYRNQIATKESEGKCTKIAKLRKSQMEGVVSKL